MYFKYGNFKHDDNDIDLMSVSSERMYSPRNQVMFDRKELRCQGRICATGQSTIRSRIQALEAGYETDLGDVGLYHDDHTKSAHFLSSAGAVNGVRVLKYEFGREGGGEYATYRTYNIAFQADYLNYEDTIVSFKEEMIVQGTGGPSWELVPTFNTIPVSYVHHLYTPQTIIQRGEAMGLQGWPLIPLPALHWMYEHLDRRMITTHSPRHIGRNLKTMYPITWRYVFSLAIPAEFAYPRQDYPGR